MIKFYSDIFNEKYRDVNIEKDKFTCVDICRACGIPDDFPISITQEGDTFYSNENPEKEYTGEVTVKIIPQKKTIRSIKKATKNIISYTLKFATGYYVINPGQFLKDSWGLVEDTFGIIGAIIMEFVQLPTQPKSLGESNNPYNITGASNSSIIGNVYPIVLGERRITPPVIIGYYTKLVGDVSSGRGTKQLHCTFCFGYGELSLKNFKLNEVLIAANSGDVRTGAISALSGWGTIYLWQNGSGSLPNENIKEIVPNLQIKQSDTPKATFSIPKHVDFIETVLNMNGLGYLNDKNEVEVVTVSARITLSQPGKTNIVVDKSYTGATRDGLQFPVDITVPSDWRDADTTMVIEKTSKDAPSGDTRRMIDIYIGSIQYRRTDTFMDTAVRNKMVICSYIVSATDAVKQNVGSFNAVATSVLPVLVDDEWTDSAPVPTKNPAAIYRAMLKGKYTEIGVDDTQIDYENINKLYEFCEDHEYYCGMCVGEQTTLSDIARKVLSSCRTQPIYQNNLYSCWVDDYQAGPSLIITPKNSRNFTMHKSFMKRPNYYNVKFYNKDANYIEDNVKVYPYGYTPQADDIGQDLETPAITSYEQVVKIARYMLACQYTRVEEYSFELGLEHFNLKKGKRIKVAHDVIKNGIANCIIKSISLDRLSAEVDEILPVQTVGIDYGLLIQNESGVISAPAYTDSIPTNTIHFFDPLDAAVTAGTLCQYGVLGEETEDCIVSGKSINQNWRATITATTYSPQIFEAEDSPVPEYVPNLTGGAYEFAIVDPDAGAQFRTNGSTIRDDGSIFFDFSSQNYEDSGETLKNYGSMKDYGDATISGGTVTSLFDTYRSLYYASSNDGGKIGFLSDNLTYKDFSFSFWLRGDLPDVKAVIYSRLDEINNSNVEIYIQDKTLKVYFQGITFDVITADTFPDGDHFVINYSAQSKQFWVYMDGNLILNQYIPTDWLDQGEDFAEPDNWLDQGDGFATPEDWLDQGVFYESQTGIDRETMAYLLNDAAGENPCPYTLQIAMFRMYSFQLENSVINSLFEENIAEINTPAQYRFLGVLKNAPLIGMPYDFFYYNGTTNNEFIQDRYYYRNPSNIWALFVPDKI